jgi:O-antigen/teichoic acid export membrane protein
LLATSLSEAFLLNVGPVAMKVLSDDEAAPGILLNGLIISRMPLFFFQAVKAALLPNLATLAGEDDLHGFRDLQLRLVGAVTAVAALSVVGMAILGPWLVETLFGDSLSSRDMLLLAASGGGLMIMLSLSLGLVALNHTRLAVIGFFVGVAVFPPALLLATDPFLSVEIALVSAVTAGALVTAALLRYEYGVHIASGRLTARTSSSAGDTARDPL